MSETLLIETAGHRVTMTLNRPARANAMDWNMLEALDAAFRDIEMRDDVDAVVIRGAQGHFCSGWDVAHPVNQPEEALRLNQRGRELIERVQRCPAITVAVLEGAIIGGGLLLAAACDIRIGMPPLRLCLPEVNFNVPVLWTSLSPLVREIGFSATRELAFSGKTYDAQWATQRGFISECLDEDALPAGLGSLLNNIDRGNGRALRTMKRDLTRLSDAVMPGAHDYGDEQVVDSVMNSILAKRG
ncbi:enoyl-CoA hydratase/isomerase family protein [Alcaligenaceae bacterium]|nr:enoyl-CoA hydratase/isomerase family protein [Alcaligenaceae bacterium]